jgi:hypothetical protein
MTITVRADIKARINEVKDEANWSAVACRAFEQELAEVIKLKGADAVKDTIERLRASRRRLNDDRFQEGFAMGQAWAKVSAEAGELERLADLRDRSSQDGWGWEGNFDPPDGASAYSAAERIAFVILAEEYDGDWGEASNFWEQQAGQEKHPPDEFVRGFAEGALEIWDLVKDEI